MTNSSVKGLQEAHPYEEPAYDVIELENADENAGLGVVGELKEAVDSAEFLQFVKEELALPCLKHSPLVKNKIKRVALCGGSGGDFVNAAKQCDADIYITVEMSYHRFFEHEKRLIMAEIGHY